MIFNQEEIKKMAKDVESLSESFVNEQNNELKRYLINFITRQIVKNYIPVNMENGVSERKKFFKDIFDVVDISLKIPMTLNSMCAEDSLKNVEQCELFKITPENKTNDDKVTLELVNTVIDKHNENIKDSLAYDIFKNLENSLFTTTKPWEDAERKEAYKQALKEICLKVEEIISNQNYKAHLKK